MQLTLLLIQAGAAQTDIEKQTQQNKGNIMSSLGLYISDSTVPRTNYIGHVT